MSADTGWKVVGKSQQHSSGPRLTVYTNGNGYVNKAADTQLLDRPDACRVLVDQERQRIALDPTDDQDPDGYSVTRENDAHGGDLRIVGALERLGVDVDALDDTHFLPLDGEGDLAVADASDLVETTTATDVRTDSSDRAMDGTTSDADASEDEADEPEEFSCTYDGCEFTSESERGKNIHETRAHDDEDEADDEPDDHGGTEVPDPEDVPSHETVRDCADGVDTVQELADLLEVEPGEARFLARDADVYRELQDQPPRPGVDR